MKVGVVEGVVGELLLIEAHPAEFDFIYYIIIAVCFSAKPPRHPVRIKHTHTHFHVFNIKYICVRLYVGLCGWVRMYA